ncbi:hypothetical protein AB0H73_00125 [Streptomyces olivoreticuli]
MTYRKLAELAVDPKTGTQVGHSTIWRIAHEAPIKIDPAVVRAIAAAVGLPDREVQIAAAQEFVGLVATDAVGASTPGATVVVAHVPGMTAGDMPKVQEMLRNWAAGDTAERTPGGGGGER